jgi:hypothetical protein
MTNKLILSITFFSLILFLNSCSSTKYSYSSIKTVDVGSSGIIQKPLVVDLDVKAQKVSGNASTSNSNLTEEEVKRIALADALQKANADILVEPRYEVNIEDGNMRVSVTGWPANYKNFRNVTNEDLPLLKIGSSQTIETSNSKPSILPKSKVNGKTILAVSSLTILAIVVAGKYLFGL